MAKRRFHEQMMEEHMLMFENDAEEIIWF